jgi:hypothetical protein
LMTESLSQKEFNQLIMLIALATCFKPGEELLSEDQIVSRGYTPTEQFGKSCIASLIDSGVIDFVRIDPAFPLLKGDECTLFIRCPVVIGDDLDSYTYRHTEKVTIALAQSENHIMHLKMFRQEVIACECVEYCEFYVKRAKLSMIGASHSNAKLRLLLLECGADIVHMLIWQAIKILENKIGLGARGVEFSDIIEISFDRYTHYKRLNTSLEGYKRPTILKASVISGFIELYRKDN